MERRGFIATISAVLATMFNRDPIPNRYEFDDIMARRVSPRIGDYMMCDGKEVGVLKECWEDSFWPSGIDDPHDWPTHEEIPDDYVVKILMPITGFTIVTVWTPPHGKSGHDIVEFHPFSAGYDRDRNATWETNDVGSAQLLAERIRKQA